MSPEGEIERVPQPIEFYEQFNRFRGAYPMRDGMVLDVTGLRSKKGGLFYLKGDKVIRIYGKSPPFIIEGVIDAPFTEGHTVSPDGCLIAFASILKFDFDANKPIKIINVCGEKE